MFDGNQLGEDARAFAAQLMRQRPFESFRAEPGFPELARAVTTTWGSRVGAGATEAERPLADITRFAGAIWLNYLEATPGGLTLQRFDRTLREVGMGGVGRARTIMTYLTYIRYIEPAPREGDGRYRHFRTTASARRVLRHRFHEELRARATHYPAALEMAERIEEDGLFDRLLVKASESSIAFIIAQLDTPNPLHVLGDRNGGLAVLAHLLTCGRPDDRFPPRGPITYSVNDLAKRSGASRMQVGHLLKTARQEGMIVATPDGGEALSENTITGVEMLVASSTLVLVGACEAALREAA